MARASAAQGKSQEKGMVAKAAATKAKVKDQGDAREGGAGYPR